MGLSNEYQAIVLGLSAFFLALGAAAATIPLGLPEDVRVGLSVFFWICGIMGFALKELSGGKPPPT